MTKPVHTRRTFLSSAAALGVAGAVNVSALGQAETPADGFTVPAWYYRHHDADYSLDVPEEGFGGWIREPLTFSKNHTAVVVMHAWDAGTRDQFPGWHRVVPYIPRADAICRDVFPRLLAAVRASDLTLFHVVGGGDYYKHLPGYQHAVEIAGPAPEALPTVASDPIRDALAAHKQTYGYPATHNLDDIARGFARLDFAPNTKPLDGEGVAENGHQLHALCREKGINHLIYSGFAINWCLLLSPGGMAEMQKYGLMCSAIRQATTAVENKASARNEWCKELALWRVALAFGFVFDVDDFVGALPSTAG
ncbi:MAG TPA: hypothetical protein PLO37_02280 [Candidatus Hydrogenedentes bacterium]|nr:hypothetical protein [Candidatus Hydrogenedentota bacterium]HPG65645.1 hypothetical protein [Candidatus Hydrogenedentota bacterium]